MTTLYDDMTADIETVWKTGDRARAEAMVKLRDMLNDPALPMKFVGPALLSFHKLRDSMPLNAT